MTARIVTYNTFPPIPVRQFDWCAYFDGEEENGGYGYGPTKETAILDLIENHPSVGGVDCECTADKPLRELSAFVLMIVGIAAGFSFLTPDCAQAAILTVEGADKYSRAADAIMFWGSFAAFMGMIIAGIMLIVRTVGKMHIGPLIPDDHGPERTREQRARDAEGQA